MSPLASCRAPSTFILSLPTALPMPCLALPTASLVVPFTLSVVLLIMLSCVVRLSNPQETLVVASEISSLPAEIASQTRHNLELSRMFAGEPKHEMARPGIGIALQPVCRTRRGPRVAHLPFAHDVGPLTVILGGVCVDAGLRARRVVI